MFAFFKDPRAVALLMAASLTILSNTIISPALPGLQARFPENPNAELMTRLLVTAPSLLVAFFAPFAGMVADRFGRRRQILVGAVLFSVAGCAGLYLPSLEMILASRLFLGLSVAMIMTGQAALIGDYFQGEARGKFMGLQIAVVNFSGFAFIALSGWLAGMSPRFPFLIYGLGILILPFLWITLKDPVRGAQSDDADESGMSDGKTGWRLLLAVIVFLSGMSFVLFYLVPTQMPFYLSTIGFDGASAPAQVLSMVTLAGGVSALAFGKVIMRLGQGLTPALGFLLMAGGFGILDWVHSMMMINLGALLIGAGFGLTMPTFFAIALDAAPARHRGLVSGAITTSIFLGQFISPIFSMPLVTTIGYEGAFGVAALILVAMAVAVGTVFHRQSRSTVPA